MGMYTVLERENDVDVLYLKSGRFVVIGLHTHLLPISFVGTLKCMQIYDVSVAAYLNTPRPKQ